ncbi:MAG TPA: Uma2 family endonuclease [Herpetosiphonaceae bacterium]
METRAQATLDDLYHVPEHGKAEFIDGEIVPMSPTGDALNRAAGAIYIRLRMYEPHTTNGRAYADNAGFSVDLPHRKSFSPDAAFYFGKASGLKFLEGAPVFAAEVRSEGDYGPKAERAIAQKIADYFAAGTLVVWDVDLLAEDVIKVYRASDPQTPTIYRRGDVAEAEPAVPGWTMLVDELFT